MLKVISDVREVVRTGLQIKMYVTDFRYNIKYTYPTSYKSYVPDLILSSMDLISDKLYGHVFVNPPFLFFDDLHVCILICPIGFTYKTYDIHDIFNIYITIIPHK